MHIKPFETHYKTTQKLVVPDLSDVHRTWHYKFVPSLKTCQLSPVRLHRTWHCRSVPSLAILKSFSCQAASSQSDAHHTLSSRRHISRLLDLPFRPLGVPCPVANRTYEVCIATEVQFACSICVESRGWSDGTTNLSGLQSSKDKKKQAIWVPSPVYTRPVRYAHSSETISNLGTTFLTSFGWFLSHLYDLGKCILSLFKYSKS
jgi:hypothetical protein